MIPRSASYIRPDLVQRLGVWRAAMWNGDAYGEAQAIAAAFAIDPRVLYPQLYQTKEVAQVNEAQASAKSPTFQFGRVSARGLREFVPLPRRSWLRRLVLGVF